MDKVDKILRSKGKKLLKKVLKEKDVPKSGKGKIIKTNITEFATKALTIYAAEVNLERATPDLIDGLKPVARRIAWAASSVAKTKLVKSALLVGEVMGKYHPHGDSSIYGAMVTMAQSTVPLLHGEGNWGTIIDGAAAMRYTNCRLSNFGRMGFDPDYANPEVTTYVPNYDDTKIEPVSVPYPLPIILFSGASGIGYGVACDIPCFTPESVADVLTRMLNKEKLKAADFAKAMKPDFKWGGEFVKTKENRQAWMEMFTGPTASVLFEAPLDIDAGKRSVTISEWPKGLSPEKLCLTIKSWPDTLKAFPSKGTSEFTFIMKKGYNSVQFEAWTKKIAKLARAKSSYNINVTRRTVTENDGVVDYKVELHSMSVPQLVTAWLRERMQIEVKSLDYRIRRVSEAIAYSELLIMAANKLDIIVPIIRKSKDPKADLMKALKLTELQANQILDLTLRKLTRLDQDVIEVQRKEQLGELKQLKKHRENPRPKMIQDIERAVEAIAADRKWYAAKDTQELTLA